MSLSAIDQTRVDAESPVAATAQTVRDAADDLAAAFVDDPIFNWFMRTGPGRGAARRAMFRLILRDAALPDGTIERPASGGAAAVWIPSENLRAQPLHRELRALPTLLAATGLGRFNRLVRLRGAMDQHHPMERPHDYLWFLGVRPDLQGYGVGSRLLAARTAHLDREVRPAFLETATPRNVTLYARHGFETVSEYRPAPDGPLIWAMWREPR